MGGVGLYFGEGGGSTFVKVDWIIQGVGLWPLDEEAYPSDGCEGLDLIFALSGHVLVGPLLVH
jgi:hypothetical protein